METLLLTRSEVKLLLNAQEIYQLLLDAFIDHSKAEQIRSQRVRSLLPNEESSAVVLFPGLASSIPAYTVKVHAKYPKQSPSINGVIHLHDLKTGGLLAIMDSTYITAVRTGISGVIGTNSLANKDAEELTIIGAGVQGQMHLNYLRSYRTIKRVRVFDTDPNKANEFAERMDHKEKIEFMIAESIEEAVKESELIFSATWSKQPFLFSSMISDGAHITAIGADEPGKSELSADLIKRAYFVCDDRKLVSEMGAIAGARLVQTAIDAEIGEIIHSEQRGRKVSEK